MGKALKYFREQDVSRLPVVEDDDAIGIVTMDDIVEQVIHPEEKAKEKKYGGYIGEKKHYRTMPLRGIMIEKLLIMPPETSIREIIEAMPKHGMRGMLIGKGATFNGIVTKKDLLEPIAALAAFE